MPASLTPEEIARLTRKADQREGSHHSRWITATDARDILTALDHDANEVAIGGEMFSISHKTNGNIFIKPTKHGKFVPCGEYSLPLLRSIAA